MLADNLSNKLTKLRNAYLCVSQVSVTKSMNIGGNCIRDFMSICDVTCRGLCFTAYLDTLQMCCGQ